MTLTQYDLGAQASGQGAEMKKKLSRAAQDLLDYMLENHYGYEKASPQKSIAIMFNVNPTIIRGWRSELNAAGHPVIALSNKMFYALEKQYKFEYYWRKFRHARSEMNGCQDIKNILTKQEKEELHEKQEVMSFE